MGSILNINEADLPGSGDPVDAIWYSRVVPAQRYEGHRTQGDNPPVCVWAEMGGPVRPIAAEVLSTEL